MIVRAIYPARLQRYSEPRCFTLALAWTVIAWACGLAPAAEVSDLGPEARAAAFLAVEVPKWAAEHHCYSCHNNGDAARALMMAMKRLPAQDRGPLEDTLKFLADPERWDTSSPQGPFNDKKLARIQFAAALTDALALGLLTDHGALERAARLVAKLQLADGSWEIAEAGSIGSPVTWGRILATYQASRVLAAADRRKYAQSLNKAQQWFERSEPLNVVSAAAILLALVTDTSPTANRQRERSLELIRQGQKSDGGWGPFVTAPAEVFDTALVLLALAAGPNNTPGRAEMIRRGRDYLVAAQEDDGSWPATTRPPGAQSYAQQLSTTGWATQALLATAAIHGEPAASDASK
ncbi:MAG TPA: hypothetical protein VHV08_00480 [Pirellulales bacterium]|nr:hypothetical protein [Pirellulales bacterium]